MKLYVHPISGHAHRTRLFLSLIGADAEIVESTSPRVSTNRPNIWQRTASVRCRFWKTATRQSPIPKRS
jgi:hypothetical protein